MTHDELTTRIEHYHLGAYREAILATAMPCRIGEVVSKPVIAQGASKLGGLPDVAPEFQWPVHQGKALEFILQLSANDLAQPAWTEGHLLFFYDNESWGGDAEDAGSAVVLHQQRNTLRRVDENELPTFERSSFFGFSKKTVRPRVYKETALSFQDTLVLPTPDRVTLPFDDECLVEEYLELMTELEKPLQLGGYPQPVQSDDMEEYCARLTNHGKPEDWRLLAQIDSVGDMMWGDAGKLYWFIHTDDLRDGRPDRVWMHMQCS